MKALRAKWPQMRAQHGCSSKKQLRLAGRNDTIETLKVVRRTQLDGRNAPSSWLRPCFRNEPELVLIRPAIPHLVAYWRRLPKSDAQDHGEQIHNGCSSRQDTCHVTNATFNGHQNLGRTGPLMHERMRSSCATHIQIFVKEQGQHNQLQASYLDPILCQTCTALMPTSILVPSFI